MKRSNTLRRWKCQQCNMIFAVQGSKPEHEHPLVGICPYGPCDKPLAYHEYACTPEHGMMAVRLAQNLPVDLKPSGPTTGLWLFAERNRLGMNRATLAQKLHVKDAQLWRFEVFDMELPLSWLELLSDVAGFNIPTRAKPARSQPEKSKTPAEPSPVESKPAPRRQSRDGVSVEYSDRGVQIDVSWKVFESAGPWLLRLLDMPKEQAPLLCQSDLLVPSVR